MFHNDCRVFCYNARKQYCSLITQEFKHPAQAEGLIVGLP
jgi:hypothetical protein